MGDAVSWCCCGPGQWCVTTHDHQHGKALHVLVGHTVASAVVVLHQWSVGPCHKLSPKSSGAPVHTHMKTCLAPCLS